MNYRDLYNLNKDRNNTPKLLREVGIEVKDDDIPFIALAAILIQLTQRINKLENILLERVNEDNES